MNGGEIELRFIETQKGFDDLQQTLLDNSVYAIDTEFHREKTYFPKLALVQIRSSQGIALIDPLNVDLSSLSKVFLTDSLAVFHAGSQDLEVLLREVGELPKRIFDTQIAAGFIGMRTPSLAALHETLLGEKLPKGDRLTDWFQRPLSTSQKEYAASDVRYLLEIQEILTTKLEERNRLDWAESEFTVLLSKRNQVVNPKDAWVRIKEAKHLNKESRGIAQALAEWRETVAKSSDIPPRYVLSDLALIGISQRIPQRSSELANIRGFDPKQYQGKRGKQLLAVVTDGLSRNVSKPTLNSSKALAAELRPAVTLLSAWLSQFAKDNDIDPSLLGTRSDIEDLLRGVENPRLAEGWRHNEVGEPIRNLLEGKSALAFSNGRLLLEERAT